MWTNWILLVFSGFVVAAGLGVVFFKRLAESAFSLFAMLIGISAIYALYEMHYALVAQIILYVGGAMVLILFALFLYVDPAEAPRWSLLKINLGKSALLTSGFVGSLFFLPWKELAAWAKAQQTQANPIPPQDLAQSGQIFASQFAVEFELIGLLLLAALLVAGWFIKIDSQKSR